jgi:hypothetical protein
VRDASVKGARGLITRAVALASWLAAAPARSSSMCVQPGGTESAVNTSTFPNAF